MPMQTGAYFYQDPIRASVETMLARSGFCDLPPEEHADTVSLLIVEAQRRIGLALMELVDDSSLALFREMMNRRATEEEITAFFSVHIPDYKRHIEDTLEVFGDECFRAAKELESVRL